MNKYYLINIIQNEKHTFLIWIENEIDTVLLKDGKVAIFNSRKSAELYALENKLIFENSDDIDYQLDVINEFILNPIDSNIDCVVFLNFWNLFSDISISLNLEFVGNDKDQLTRKIYDKLFYGNNLPAFTPEGKEYIPIWSKEEKFRIAIVLEKGIGLLDSYSAFFLVSRILKFR